MSEATTASNPQAGSVSTPPTSVQVNAPPASKYPAPATVSKRVQMAKRLFRRAERWGLIPSSPLVDLKAGSQSNPKRFAYVSVETTRAVLDACPDPTWRVLVALCRFAGPRCPSEVAELKWGDVNWEKSVLVVRSPKNAAHEAHAFRMVPIVPELQDELQAAYDAADEGTLRVVPWLRSGTNPRTHLLRIIERAGVTAWPRLYQNLRASCENDWVEKYPAHVAGAWIGHSPTVQAKHYLHVRDAHFEAATKRALKNAPCQ